MFYALYQSLSNAMEPMRMAATAATRLRPALGRWGEAPIAHSWFAALDAVANNRITHDRPAYRITSVPSGNREAAVREEIVFTTPFANLLRFAKPDSVADQPKVLIVAPMSGHFATLLRNTVSTMLRDHDVYITDWKNARDIPLSAGRFGMDEYLDHVIAFMNEIGPGAHMMAVCQPCIQALSATAIMAADKHPATPLSLTLMGGPVDVRINPTVVNDLANTKSFEWFENNLISRVPWQFRGAGRRVYPGFVQLNAFMSMNMGRHNEQFRTLYQHLADGETEKAGAIREFYDEYLAVLDMDADFYLETIDRVFQRALLAQGKFEYRGRTVDCGAIRRTALLTVEGERDDICSVGQTAAAHDLCINLRPHLKRRYLQPGVGHYGVFSGKKWDNQIYPQVRNFILAAS
jgi:polyhydroxyalkanoate depolymerase